MNIDSGFHHVSFDVNESNRLNIFARDPHLVGAGVGVEGNGLGGLAVVDADV